jgi:hypothetical protein
LPIQQNLQNSCTSSKRTNSIARPIPTRAPGGRWGAIVLFKFREKYQRKIEEKLIVNSGNELQFVGANMM